MEMAIRKVWRTFKVFSQMLSSERCERLMCIYSCIFFVGLLSISKCGKNQHFVAEISVDTAPPVLLLKFNRTFPPPAPCHEIRSENFCSTKAG